MSASDLSAAGYVMPEFALAILLASAFTFGCAVIYAWREHARQLTLILASVTTGLALLTGMMALAQNGAISPADGSKLAPMGRAQVSSWRSDKRMVAVQKPTTAETRQALSAE